MILVRGTLRKLSAVVLGSPDLWRAWSLGILLDSRPAVDACPDRVTRAVRLGGVPCQNPVRGLCPGTLKIGSGCSVVLVNDAAEASSASYGSIYRDDDGRVVIRRQQLPALMRAVVIEVVHVLADHRECTDPQHPAHDAIVARTNH
jgi:hypothetical protein